ncbi:cryptochrome/photolyase family protein [Salipaludibacillus sp. HK11]|uniref:cryptochrome/photolyase family protein n=1 Tax=Salipaludibacillus sp. HK11 TaxID=3394320 RepID=UPI0039FDACBE
MKPLYAVWLRNDFRFHDQPVIHKALESATSSDGEVIFFFHIHPRFLEEKVDTHHDYFFKSLQQFREECAHIKIHIHLIYGNNSDAFTKLTNNLPDLAAVFHLKDFTPFGRKRDADVAKFLKQKDVETYPVNESHLVQPDQLTKEDGTPYKVFTPYYRQWIKHQKQPLVKIDRNKLMMHYKKIDPIDIDTENYFENDVLFQRDFQWLGLGEDTALKRLELFLDERITYYDKSRDQPAIAGTSQLSPYIKTGVLSVRKIYYSVFDRLETSGKGAESYLKELAWRDFYAMIYYFYPNIKNQEYQEKYRSIEWSTDSQLFNKWKTGTTGFPIVDAGMRQLNEIGWMHNRLRMVTASFLTKDYLIDWRMGEKYFSKKLIDYDEASNIGGWQWAASVGTDAVPYFRVFNPTRQAERFDTHGQFIKKYLPELADIPTTYIHKLEKIPSDVQQKINFHFGKDYPVPSVDHALQRKKAIELFKGEEDHHDD